MDELLPRILIVEDNKADVFLIQEAIAAAGVRASMEVLPDGDKAIQYLQQSSGETCACPALMILDINLPKRTGGEVLQFLRASKTCGQVPVLIVTSSDSAREREMMAKLGANGYFCKPSDYEAYLKLGTVVKEMLG